VPHYSLAPERGRSTALDRFIDDNFYIETREDQTEGLLATYRVRQPEELLYGVLGWGGGVVVLEPESFGGDTCRVFNLQDSCRYLEYAIVK
jgi:predicted DNA-binding transcriptional regulator YafY